MKTFLASSSIGLTLFLIFYSAIYLDKHYHQQLSLFLSVLFGVLFFYGLGYLTYMAIFGDSELED